MNTLPVIIYTWNGESMQPLPRFAAMAKARFASHELYRMEVVEERSVATHNHYFAIIHEAWLNLPEHCTGRFANEDHLRKWCLITAGFRSEQSIVASSKEEAQHIAAFVKPTADDTYAIVIVQECVVTIYTAASQSRKAMGKADFQASKEAVIEVLSRMLGTEVTELTSRVEPPNAHNSRNGNRRRAGNER